MIRQIKTKFENEYYYLAYFLFALLFLLWVVTTYRNIVHMDIMNILGSKVKNLLEHNLQVTDFVYHPLFPAFTSLSFTYLNVELFHLNTVLESVLGTLFLILLGYRYLSGMSCYLASKRQKLLFSLLTGFIVFGLHKWEASFTSFFSFAVYFNLCICFFSYFFIFRWVDKDTTRKSKWGFLFFILTNLLVIFEAPAYYYSYILSAILLLLTARRFDVFTIDRKRWNILLGTVVSLLILAVSITVYLSNHPLYKPLISNISTAGFLQAFLERPFWMIQFYLITHSGPFLGEAFNYPDLRAAFGFMILLLYAWSIYYVIKKKDKRLLIPAAMIFYNIISCGFIMMSRYIFNVLEYGASSRYTAFNMQGVLGLTTILFFYIVEEKEKAFRMVIFLSMGFIILSYLYVDRIQILTSPSRADSFRQMRTSLLTGENLEILQAGKSKCLSAIEVLKRYKLNVYYEASKAEASTVLLDRSKKILLRSGSPEFKKLNKIGFYDNENGISWTNGKSMIALNNYFIIKDTLTLEMKTYMPPACKNVFPKISLMAIDQRVFQPFYVNRKVDTFVYKFSFDSAATIHKINILSETIDAGADLRKLSFPFKSLEIKTDSRPL